MQKWRFLSLSMPILVALLFGIYGGGAERERAVETLFMLPVPSDMAPQWGVIRDRMSLLFFMRKFFPEEELPNVDFDRQMLIFLLNGPEGGPYADFEIRGYSGGSAEGITIFCEKGVSSPSGQLASVPRFSGEAVFFFRQAVP